MTLKIPPPVQALIAAFLMWGCATLFTGLNVSFSGQLIVAAIIGVIGFSLDLISLRAFLRAKTTINPTTPQDTQTLVISGLYRVSRNPMYLGLLLILIGWGIWLGNPINILILVMFVVAITELQIKPEEKILSEKFGAAFETYRTRVRRWI